MPDRPRATRLVSATVCFALFGALAVAVRSDRSPLGAIDNWGRSAAGDAEHHPWLIMVLRWIEIGFDTVGMTIITTLIVIALAIRKHHRAAIFIAGTALVTTALTNLVKVWVGRARPDWQDPLGLLSSRSFPSGHSSSTACLALGLAVLVGMYVRRSSVRKASYAGLVLLVLTVMSDRVLLGRHYPTDTVAGALLGLGVVLVGLVAYSPQPRPHAEGAEPIAAFNPTGTRKLAVILNPIKVESVEGFRHLVETMATESGWEGPTWHYTTVEDPGTGMAHDAAVEGADLVLVCGGDGTVREVCAELAGTGIPVGVVPAGTGNLLARNLDIPLYLRAAIDVALNGQDRAIDMVEVTGDGIEDTHFMVMAGMGFDAAIMEGVNEDIKARIGWFAYVLSALKSLMFPVMRLEVTIDGGPPTSHRARTVVVGNVGYLQAGMPLLPDAAIDDGMLDVVLLHPKRFLSWVPLAARVLAKSSRTDETIERMTGRSVVVRSTSDIPRQLDGDACGPGKELRMECIPGRVLVRVPR